MVSGIYMYCALEIRSQREPLDRNVDVLLMQVSVAVGYVLIVEMLFATVLFQADFQPTREQLVVCTMITISLLW